MISIEIIAIGISAIVCLTAICTFIVNRFSDHGKREQWQGHTTSQLNSISDDVKDMKIQQRNTDRALHETRTIAITAKNAAVRAHERLDKIHAPSAYELSTYIDEDVDAMDSVE